MKLLMIYTDRFAYSPAVKTLEEEPDCHDPGEIKATVVALIHAESFDDEDPTKVKKKVVKSLKLGARKNETERIAIHTFSHLAETKASAEFTKALLARAAERLRGSGYDVWQTPFGYFLDLDLQAPYC